MSRPRFETPCSKTEMRLWVYQTETLKKVSRDVFMFRGIHFCPLYAKLSLQGFGAGIVPQTGECKGAFTAVYSTFFFQRDLGLFY